MKAKLSLEESGDEIQIENICPFMSSYKSGCGRFIGAVKCVGCKCQCWDNNKKDCGMKVSSKNGDVKQ